MSSSSRLCIEHVENIGIHYYQTLRMWRKNFLDRQKPIMALGFDDKFIRTWEYYFDYCAAGFKTLTLGNYQVAFSRPGNVAAFADSYKGFPSAYYFISIPEERYNEYRLSSDFIKEYIFPGGCLPSLARVTSAMSSSSRLCIEHVENIGIHYYQTLRMWRKNFLDRQKPIIALGCDDKFIRTWEYYFDYCAAGFKTLTLGNYQVVFSRPGNVAAFADSYKGFPSAYYVA
ncbi:hypothetical protein F2Q69_00053655 [Brassica cretica]|uniref:Uncharacterized protein n=1 Tax=Brassica cretica TaxID=69181 RepID=A0A8S9MXL6_BRACR|nr:hypothetical protein F2Q69_00053655 [Brassica cretica]